MRSETYESILEQIRATPDTPPESIAECGHCHFRWNDDMSTELTPAPSARCPNEYHHEYPEPASEDLFKVTVSVKNMRTGKVVLAVASAEDVSDALDDALADAEDQLDAG